jgi:ATP-dependent DNA helicase RecG
VKFKESETMELKSKLTNDLKKEVVAFANTRGGTIYIGVEDGGNITEIQGSLERICEQISSMIHDGIKLDVTMFVEITAESIDNKDVVKIVVQRGTKRPYYLTDKGLKPSGVYIRMGNTSVPATETFIRNMIIETDGTSYEQMRSINQELTFQTAEAEFRKHAMAFEIPHKKTLGIIDHDGIYTNLGLLISDQCPHSIKAAIFKGINKDEFLTRKEFTGSLFKQIEDAYSFIDLANQLHSTFEGLNRIDSRDYSETAIREILLNAVIHRDYSFSGSILISIFNDRMEIVSLGGLVPGLEIDDIFEGISQSRNPGLADVFYRLNYVEAYGTGIRKIQSECEKIGVKAEFSVSNAAFRVILPNRNSFQSNISKETGIEDEVLQYIQEHKKVSRKEIQQAFGLKQTKCGLILKTLETQGFIKKYEAGRNTVYQIIRS